MVLLYHEKRKIERTQRENLRHIRSISCSSLRGFRYNQFSEISVSIEARDLLLSENKQTNKQIHCYYNPGGWMVNERFIKLDLIYDNEYQKCCKEFTRTLNRYNVATGRWTIGLWGEQLTQRRRGPKRSMILNTREGRASSTPQSSLGTRLAGRS